MRRFVHLGAATVLVAAMVTAALVASPALAAGRFDGTYHLEFLSGQCSTPAGPVSAPAFPAETFTVTNNVVAGAGAIPPSGVIPWSVPVAGISITGDLRFVTMSGGGMDITGTATSTQSISGYGTLQCHSTVSGYRTSAAPQVTSPASSPEAIIVPSPIPGRPPAATGTIPAPPSLTSPSLLTCHFSTGPASQRYCLPKFQRAATTAGTTTISQGKALAVSAAQNIADGATIVTHKAVAWVADTTEGVKEALASSTIVKTYQYYDDPLNGVEDICASASPDCPSAIGHGYLAVLAKGALTAWHGDVLGAISDVSQGTLTATVATGKYIAAAARTLPLFQSGEGAAAPDTKKDPVLEISVVPAGSWFYDLEGAFAVIDSASRSLVHLAAGESVFVPNATATPGARNLALGIKHFPLVGVDQWWLGTSHLLVTPLDIVISALVVFYLLLIVATHRRRKRLTAARRTRRATQKAAKRAKRAGLPPPSVTTPATTEPISPPSSTTAASLFVADELAKLAELRDRSVISTEEFESQKSALLARG